jgi:pantothenate synthetase
MEKLREAGLRPEYFELVDGFSLAPIRSTGAIKFTHDTGMGDGIVACTAAFAGDVRLIDNLVLAP